MLDFNNITTPGIYAFSAANEINNCPYNISVATLIVSSYAIGARAHQLFWGDTGVIYSRFLSGNGWGSWAKN